MTNILIHHLGLSQSERIVWLCEELGLDYELRRYERDPQTGMAPAEYKALHPMGIAPVVEIDGRGLAESGAIIDHMVATLGGGRLTLPPGHPDHFDWLFWSHLANATIIPAAMMGIMGQMMEPEGANPLADRSDRAMAMIEERLAANAWFAGDEFTTSDIMMVFPLTTMRLLMPLDLSPYPRTRDYLERVGARDAYRRALERAEPGFAPLLA